MSVVDGYKGRKWILALQETPLSPALVWGLRRSTAARAMIPPFLATFFSTAVAFYLLRASVLSIVPPVIGVTLVLSVFWPLGLCSALCMDLVRKEYKYQRCRSSDARF